jgi:hypothetical protein
MTKQMALFSGAENKKATSKRKCLGFNSQPREIILAHTYFSALPYGENPCQSMGHVTNKLDEQLASGTKAFLSVEWLRWGNYTRS